MQSPWLYICLSLSFNCWTVLPISTKLGMNITPTKLVPAPYKWPRAISNKSTAGPPNLCSGTHRYELRAFFCGVGNSNKCLYRVWGKNSKFDCSAVSRIRGNKTSWVKICLQRHLLRTLLFTGRPRLVAEWLRKR